MRWIFTSISAGLLGAAVFAAIDHKDPIPFLLAAILFQLWQIGENLNLK